MSVGDYKLDIVNFALKKCGKAPVASLAQKSEALNIVRSGLQSAISYMCSKKIFEQSLRQTNISPLAQQNPQDAFADSGEFFIRYGRPIDLLYVRSIYNPFRQADDEISPSHIRGQSYGSTYNFYVDQYSINIYLGHRHNEVPPTSDPVVHPNLRMEYYTTIVNSVTDNFIRACGYCLAEDSAQALQVNQEKINGIRSEFQRFLAKEEVSTAPNQGPGYRAQNSPLVSPYGRGISHHRYNGEYF